MKILDYYLPSLLTLISILPWASFSLIEECPDPFDTYPCYCEEDDDLTVIHCNNLNESQQIQRALSKLSDYRIYQVSIYKNNINAIKSNAFQGPALSQIIFMNSSVTFDSPQFVGLELSLKRLTFLYCFDEENDMRPFSFGHLQNLRDVTFDRNEIRILKNGWLTSSGERLKSITFSYCRIAKLEDKVFQNLDNLATLYLNDNEIPSIARTMFPREAKDLRIIYLNNNKLQDLPDDIFENMPSLNSLDLQNNQLKTLSETTWSFVIENLTGLYLDDNPIWCDSDLKWISKVNLPKIFTGKCKGPRKLQNKNLRLLMPSDFH